MLREAVMRRAAILGLSGGGGAGAFLWSLLARMPPEVRPEQPQGWQPGPARAIGAVAIRWPRDLPSLNEFVTQNPGEYAAWFDLAELRRNAGDASGEHEAWARVVDEAAKRVGDQAEELRAWFMMGWACDKIGREAEAEIAYDHAIERSEARSGAPEVAQSPRFWHRLGWAYQRMGRNAQAETAWEMAVELLRARGMGGGDRTLMLA